MLRTLDKGELSGALSDFNEARGYCSPHDPQLRECAQEVLEQLGLSDIVRQFLEEEDKPRKTRFRTPSRRTNRVKRRTTTRDLVRAKAGRKRRRRRRTGTRNSRYTYTSGSDTKKYRRNRSSSKSVDRSSSEYELWSGYASSYNDEETLRDSWHPPGLRRDVTQGVYIMASWIAWSVAQGLVVLASVFRDRISRGHVPKDFIQPNSGDEWIDEHDFDNEGGYYRDYDYDYEFEE